MLRVPNHVHYWYACFVKLLNDILGWNADSSHEEGSLACNDYIDELRQLSSSVVAVRLSCSSPDLWEKQIDTKLNRQLTQHG